MFTTICLFLLLCLIIIAAEFGRRFQRAGNGWEEPDARIAYGISAAAGILFLVLLFFSTFNLIRATEVGVPVSFGKVGDPMPSGVHFVAPWVDVETYPTRPRNEDVTAKVRTADAGSVTVATTTRWRVNTEDARELYFQVRTGDEERIGREVVQRNLSQAIGDTYNGIRNIDVTVRTGRAEAIQQRLTQLVAPYGIEVTALQLRDVDPDAVTSQSIADFAAQQRKTSIAGEAAKTAEQDARRRLIEAIGLKNAANQIPNLTAEQASALCVQAWERAINSGKPIYTSPCGGGGVIPTVVAGR